MPVAVYEHPHDARRRLAEIGVSIEAIQKAVSAGHVARISCTENDPPFIPGIEAWRFVVRTLRDELLAQDLRRAAIVLEHPTWVLLIHINDDEYRAELSFPDEMDEGQITSWKERIFIPNEGDESGAVVSPDVEPGPEFDVPVRRKA